MELKDGDDIEIRVAEARVIVVSKRAGPGQILERPRGFRSRLPEGFQFDRETISTADHDLQNLFIAETLRDLATHALGDAQEAETWLEKPTSFLDGLSPLQMATTAKGELEVRDYLMRLAYGVYT